MISKIDVKELIFITFDTNKILTIGDKIQVFVPNISNPSQSYFTSVNIVDIRLIFNQRLGIITDPLTVYCDQSNKLSKFVYQRTDYRLSWFSITDDLSKIDALAHYSKFNNIYNLNLITDISLIRF